MNIKRSVSRKADVTLTAGAMVDRSGYVQEAAT